MMTPEQEKAWDRVFGYCTDTREKSDDYPTSGLDVDEKEAILAIDKERTSLRAEVERLNKVLDWIEMAGFGWGDKCAWSTAIKNRRKAGKEG